MINRSHQRVQIRTDFALPVILLIIILSYFIVIHIIVIQSQLTVFILFTTSSVTISKGEFFSSVEKQMAMTEISK